MSVENPVDPVVEEVHRVRQEHITRFDDDLAAIFNDVRKRQYEASKHGAVMISAPLRSAEYSADQPAA